MPKDFYEFTARGACSHELTQKECDVAIAEVLPYAGVHITPCDDGEYQVRVGRQLEFKAAAFKREAAGLLRALQRHGLEPRICAYGEPEDMAQGWQVTCMAPAASRVEFGHVFHGLLELQEPTWRTTVERGEGVILCEAIGATRKALKEKIEHVLMMAGVDIERANWSTEFKLRRTL